ncbi:MAG: M20/M25/M40 family metallo-hydrolase [Terriglobales bacterium]
MEGNGLRAAVEAHQSEAMALWRRWVERETPSGAKAALDALGREIAASFAVLGFAEEFAADAGGDHVILRRAGQGAAAGGRGSGWLLLGHLDTVYPRGTTLRMPWRLEGERVCGPGVMDMKGGIAVAWLALRALHGFGGQAGKPAPRSGGVGPVGPVTVLLVSDEETGSAGSRALTERLARQARAVLVLEPGGGETGKLKTARKGIANFTLRAEGRAAHAGVDYFAGANAIVELARQAVELAGWSDEARGVTVNCGVLHGGTRGNVVPAEADLVVDARAWTAAELAAIAARIARLQPVDPRVRLTVGGGVNRPPMEPSAATAELFARAQLAGHGLGLAIEECATGGGSDGNFTAALGIPTLDGLGVVGGGAHSPREWAHVHSLAERAALLAALLSAPGAEA